MENLNVNIHDPDTYATVLNAGGESARRSFKTFQSKDIQEIAKVSKTQLIHWTQQGAILPLEDARGRGKIRIYDYQNLIETIICRELTELSIGTRHAKEMLKWLRETKWNFVFYFDFKLFEKTETQKLLMQEFVRQSEKWLNETPPDIQAQRIRAITENESNTDDSDEARKGSIIERKHTIWEYLRLYPTSLFEFYLIIFVGKNGTRHVSIADLEGSDRIFNVKSAMIINLAALISEAGNVYGDA